MKLFPENLIALISMQTFINILNIFIQFCLKFLVSYAHRPLITKLFLGSRSKEKSLNFGIFQKFSSINILKYTKFGHKFRAGDAAQRPHRKSARNRPTVRELKKFHSDQNRVSRKKSEYFSLPVISYG